MYIPKGETADCNIIFIVVRTNYMTSFDCKGNGENILSFRIDFAVVLLETLWRVFRWQLSQFGNGYHRNIYLDDSPTFYKIICFP